MTNHNSRPAGALSRATSATARAAAACLTAAGLTAAAIAPAAAAQTGPKITEFTLENGMQAVVIEDRRAPVVTHMVWYRVGAADEPPGRSGIAHFLEHLMFKGTDTIPKEQFSRIISENGGRDNAFTSQDYTGYFQRIASDRLGLVMEMEADRMRNLVIDEDVVRTERDVVLEERSQRTDNNPQSKFFEQMSAALYMNHPYGVPIIGWRHEIEQLSMQDALDFYARFYAPEKAILVVAGDVEPDAVKALAEEHYGPIPAAGLAPRARPVEPPQLSPRRLELRDERVRQPFVSRAYLAPSYVTAAEPRRAEALLVLAEILGGGAASRLSREVVQEQKIAISAGAYYSGYAMDHTSFAVYGVPAPGRTLAGLEAAIGAVMADLTETGPTEQELERAKNVLVASRIYQQDSQSSMARLYGLALTIGLSVEDVRGWPERVRAVTAEDVVAAAKSLDPSASVTGYLRSVEKDADDALAERTLAAAQEIAGEGEGEAQ